jgi:hypothetical protein
MISSTRATRTERWSRSLTFELDAASASNDAASGSQQGANSRRRTRRPFASASAALSEGVGAKAAASYSPPPPKPKVGAHLMCGLLSQAVLKREVLAALFFACTEWSLHEQQGVHQQ